jgi:hypothetical protein
MVESALFCSNCGSDAVPKGARFCPQCGTSVGRIGSGSAAAATDDSSAVPMVAAVPMMMDGGHNTNVSATMLSSMTVDDDRDRAPPHAEEEEEATPPTGARPGTNPTPAGVNAAESDNKKNNNNNNIETALFWKNPSPAMLSHAAKYEAMGGVLFISTHGRYEGKFTVPKTIHVGQVLTATKIDLSVADFVHPVSTISVGTVLGGLKVTVPRGVRVETHGIGILGAFRGIDSQTVNAGQGQDAPLVIVQGMTILGGATVVVNRGVPPIHVIEE